MVQYQGHLIMLNLQYILITPSIGSAGMPDAGDIYVILYLANHDGV